jgi:hypothetical protein
MAARELKLMSRKAVLVVLLCLLACSPALGQEWARKMFESTDHDFGTVARGAKAEFDFALSNIYLEDAHISGVRSSCGCTSLSIVNPNLKTYEKGAIHATFNTGAFLGARGATVTVTFDKPFPAEVQLHTKGFIRSDVVVEPGSVQIGDVDQGAAAERRVAVNFNGRNDWKITGVKSANPYLTAEVVETVRNWGQVSYALVVRLRPDAPVGYIKDHVMLATNDAQGTQIPVEVEGRILSSITVSPTSLFLGVVQPGQKVTKQLVVKGAKPFRILSITCDDKSFEFGTPTDQTPKTLHLVPVTFIAGENAGKIAKTIKIQTDLGATAPELSAYAVVAKP